MVITSVIGSGSLAGPLWGQWSGTNPIWTNSNVGIGTASPSSMLQVVGSQLRWDSSATGTDPGILFLTYSNAYAEIRAGQISNYTIPKNLVLNSSGGNVGIGTTVPQYKLAVNGVVGAKEVIVTNTGWPDYVFRPGYRLRPLSEVGAYIRTHHRLPDIPSEAEVKRKGVGVGEMQARLLAKIEELTLHLIQQERRIAELEARLAGR